MQVPELKYYGPNDLQRLPQLQKLPRSEVLAMQAVAQIFPFRTNSYVVENLIDWDDIPDDPMFRLTFPHRDMLPAVTLRRLVNLLTEGVAGSVIQRYANEIRSQLHPHPEGQKEYNVPFLDGQPVQGAQHKYRETLLVFPSAGQSCHAFCTFCFRWPQFVGVIDWRFATREHGLYLDYLRRHREITDVLLTGGDPMTMNARQLSLYVKPLLGPGFEHVQTIRIGTKALTYWPYRYLTDSDADDLLRLFESVGTAGKHLAVMTHFCHWKALQPPAAQSAIQRLRSAGVEIRSQSPLVRHINDTPVVWIKLWKLLVRYGCIPYYMFVQRQTGPHDYFKVPLRRCLEIYRRAVQSVSGLSRTARGPVMSALPGKVCIDGIAEVNGERVFVLSFLQGRNPAWCGRPFFAKYSDTATWLTDLEPASGQKEFFYQPELREILTRKAALKAGMTL